MKGTAKLVKVKNYLEADGCYEPTWSLNLFVGFCNFKKKKTWFSAHNNKKKVRSAFLLTDIISVSDFCIKFDASKKKGGGEVSAFFSAVLFQRKQI